MRWLLQVYTFAKLLKLYLSNPHIVHKPQIGKVELFFFFFFFFFLKIYLFIICKYTVAVFRHSRRGSQILIKMVVSHHVVAGI
jgi:hypothetical protein